MKAQSNRVFIVLGVLLIATLSCQPAVPAGPTPGAGDLALTGTAIVQTLSARASDTPAVIVSATFPTGVIPTATELAPVVSETSARIIDTPAPPFTAVPSVPMVSVTVETNCRTGPGRVYDRVAGAQVGVKYLIVGKHSPDYWIIKHPDGPECWLWDEHAIVEGQVESLPEFAAPPTPTPLPVLGTILVTVRGPVQSGDNAAAIENATVTFAATGEQAEPLGDGVYTFRNVSIGLKEIMAEAPNYQFGYGSANVVGSAEPSRVEIHVKWMYRRFDECTRLRTSLLRRNCYVVGPFPSLVAPFPTLLAPLP